MPNRIIKESVCVSEQIDQLTPFEEVFFYRLLVNCDDYGCFDARERVVSSRLFPLRDIKTTEIAKALKRLEAVGLIRLYTVDGKPFLFVIKWGEHQRLRVSKHKYPTPEDADNCENSPQAAANCGKKRLESESEIESESESERKTAKRFTPPTVDEVDAYCKERNNGINAQHFVDYYQQGNWVLKNGRKMTDWKAAVRTWEGNGYHNKPASGNPSPVKTVTAQQYSQRDYSGADEEAWRQTLSLVGG